MSRPPEVSRGCPRRRTQACVLRTEHARGFPGRRQGRESWRGQCRAGEEEGGADRGSALSRSLARLPLHQTEAPVWWWGARGGPRERGPSTRVGVPLSG